MKFNSESAKAAGAKSKRGPSERTKLLENLLKPETAKQVFQKLEERAKAGDMDAIKTYLAYCFGKPKESLDLTTGGESLNVVLKKVDGR